MRPFSQSIHLNPETDDGREILAILLAVPRYQRGALIRRVLHEQIRAVALRQWLGLQPKTDADIRDILAARRARRGRPRAKAEQHERGALPGPPTGTTTADSDDLDARLDRLDFGGTTP